MPIKPEKRQRKTSEQKKKNEIKDLKKGLAVVFYLDDLEKLGEKDNAMDLFDFVEVLLEKYRPKKRS